MSLNSFRDNDFPSNAKVTFFSSSNHKHSFACLRRHLSISPVNRNVNSHSSHLPSSVKIISTAASKLNLGSNMFFPFKSQFPCDSDPRIYFSQIEEFGIRLNLQSARSIGMKMYYIEN